MCQSSITTFHTVLALMAGAFDADALLTSAVLIFACPLPRENCQKFWSAATRESLHTRSNRSLIDLRNISLRGPQPRIQREAYAPGKYISFNWVV